MATGFPPKATLHLELGPRESRRYAATARQVFAELGWELLEHTHNRVVALVPGKLVGKGEIFSATLVTDGVELRSQCAGFRPLDFGRNQQNIEAFLQAAEEAERTIGLAAFDVEQAAPVTRRKARTFRRFRRPPSIWASLVPGRGQVATPLLLHANILYFIVLLFSGADPLFPDSDTLLAFGANYKPLVAAGEYWRLFAAMFLHIGALHLLVNMVALVLAGNMLEHAIGAARTGLVYVCAGLISSASSIWWNEEVLSAGASGAVFGMLGALSILLTAGFLGHRLQKRALGGIVLFVGYVLLQGSDGSLDTAAHLGGIFGGLLMGMLMLPSLQQRKSPKLAIGTSIGAAMAAGLITLLVVTAVPDYYARYDSLMNAFSQNEARGMEIFQMPTNLSREEQVQRLQQQGVAFWEDNLKILDEIEEMDELPLHLLQRTRLMRSYCELRLSTLELIVRSISEQTSRYDAQIFEHELELEALVNSLDGVE